MKRSIDAVGAGFVVIFLLTLGTDVFMLRSFADAYDATGRAASVGVLLLTLAYVGVYTVVGCYLTALVARNHPLTHALILGVIELVFTAGSAVAGWMHAWANAPAWYHVMAVATVLPCAWLGGRLREKQLERGSPIAAPAR